MANRARIGAAPAPPSASRGVGARRMAVPQRRSMAVPRRQNQRSATVAATLSFLLPGAGQAYTRRWRPAVIFGLPTLAGLALLGNELAQGVSHFAARLLDPAVALTVLLATVVFGVWRVAAVFHAWRAGRRTLMAWMVMPLLVALIVASHGFAYVSATAVLNAGNQMASGGDGLLGPVATLPAVGAGATPTPLAPTSSAQPGATPDRAPSPSADPQTDGDPYNDHDDDAEPTITRGQPPPFDVAGIDTATDGWLNVLIVGIDWMPGRDSRRTDTMIVVSTNTTTGEVYMFSFPRDIAQFPVYTGGTFNGKLNGFARYASRDARLYPDGGLKSLGYQVGYLLGIPIDYYAAVDIPGFERVVREIGGVTIYNETEINDTYIHGGKGFFLPVGQHRLNAADTLSYVRSRKGSSDFARAHRQQQVLTALRREMTKPEKLANLPAIMDAIGQVLRTDFPRERISELLKLSEQVNDEPTNGYVFRSPEWATFHPRSETGGRTVTTLRIDKLRELSLQVFGEQSLYSR
ncbi:MAG TPA: LCP family protein [Candidatus Limnocylindrales bacterium]|nr:LCP family protein [Candidatus Limnocylindrales bacterium]